MIYTSFQSDPIGISSRALTSCTDMITLGFKRAKIVTSMMPKLVNETRTLHIIKFCYGLGTNTTLLVSDRNNRLFNFP